MKCDGKGRGNRGKEDGVGLLGSKEARRSYRKDTGIQQPRDKCSKMHMVTNEQDVALASSMLMRNSVSRGF